MSAVEIRQVRDQNELQSAFAIRYRVFVEEQGVPVQEEIDEHEDDSCHYLALYEGIPVATARWRTTPKGVKLERFAVLIGYRRQGIGQQLLQRLLADVQHIHPGKPIYLHAQLPARRLYERAGFMAEGNEFDECGIRHVLMRWQPRPTSYT